MTKAKHIKMPKSTKYIEEGYFDPLLAVEDKMYFAHDLIKRNPSYCAEIVYDTWDDELRLFSFPVGTERSNDKRFFFVFCMTPERVGCTEHFTDMKDYQAMLGTASSTLESYLRKKFPKQAKS